jgi:nitrite reductase/ring-hydroxylating ferredoxin subunit
MLREAAASLLFRVFFYLAWIWTGCTCETVQSILDGRDNIVRVNLKVSFFFLVKEGEEIFAVRIVCTHYTSIRIFRASSGVFFKKNYSLNYYLKSYLSKISFSISLYPLITFLFLCSLYRVVLSLFVFA